MERHSLHHVLQSAEDCEPFAESAGNGCGMSVYVGLAEKLYIGRRMRLALAGAGGIGVASHVLCVV